jgi:plasmid stabilization system protein ParE
MQISDYLVKNWNLQIAEKFQKIFFAKVELLAKNPKIARISSRYDYVRSISITKQNRLYYRSDEHTIFLITLLDTRQNPAKNKFE